MVVKSELGRTGSGRCMGSVLTVSVGTSDDAPEIDAEVDARELDGAELELEKKDPMMRNIEGRVMFTHGPSPTSIIYYQARRRIP